MASRSRDSGLPETPLRRGGQAQNQDLPEDDSSTDSEDSSDPIMANIKGGEFNALPTFSGTPEEGIEVFVRAVIRTGETFGWAEDKRTAAAKTRLQGTALIWLTNQEADGKPMAAWGGANGLRAQLIERFKGRTTVASAAVATVGIKLRADERIRDLYDRIRAAARDQVLLDPDITEGTDGYRTRCDQLTFTTMAAAILDTKF